MSDTQFDSPSEPIPETEPEEPMSWLDIWGYSISKPSVATFREILQDPKAKLNPYIWVGLASLLSYIISIGLQALFGVIFVRFPSSQFGNQLHLFPLEGDPHVVQTSCSDPRQGHQCLKSLPIKHLHFFPT